MFAFLSRSNRVQSYIILVLWFVVLMVLSCTTTIALFAICNRLLSFSYHLVVWTSLIAIVVTNRKGREFASIGLNNAHNDSKNAQRRGKNFHNQNFDKQGRVLGIGNRTGGSRNPNADSRSNIGESH